MEENRMEFRPLIKSINLLNLSLMALSLIFAYDFLFPQMDSKATFVLASVKKKPAEQTPTEAAKAQNPSPMDYVVIADENLFHPERRIPPEKKDEAALPKPEFILFGTLITPDLTFAYMEDKKAPVTTPGRGKRQSALKKGESLSGFTVKEIMANKVVMSRGEETLTVFLDDPRAPKTRAAPVAAGPLQLAPGIPGTRPPSPVAGQPSMPPNGTRPTSMAPGGMPTPPFPTSPTGVGSFPQPTPSPGGAPSFPARRSRTIPPTTP
jgi:hypothetical protein